MLLAGVGAAVEKGLLLFFWVLVLVLVLACVVVDDATALLPTARRMLCV